MNYLMTQAGEACIDSRYEHEARDVWNMLIGGPNQSHKVNFKEPAPRRGKISKKTFGFSVVNTFPEFFRKKCWKGTPVFWIPGHHSGIAAHDVDRREGGKCKRGFRHQDLFIRFLNWMPKVMKKKNLGDLIFNKARPQTPCLALLMLTQRPLGHCIVITDTENIFTDSLGAIWCAPLPRISQLRGLFLINRAKPTGW